MPDTFLALPVGMGDAFFYHRGPHRILVDGGGPGTGATKLPALLKKCLPKVDALDIVVCTHNDGDHTLGLIALLERWAGTISEMWLPGSWSYGLDGLLQDPQKFATDLSADVGATANPDGRPWNWFQKFADSVSGQVSQYSVIDGPQGWLADATQQALSHSPEWHGWASVRGSSPINMVGINRQDWKDRVLLIALKLAENIYQIARLAARKGVRLRWFDHAQFGKMRKPSGGNTGVLEPVNACEIGPRRINIKPLEYIALTTSNRESLVFHSPTSGGTPGVLFCADSVLDFPLPTSTSGSMIVTASHHGARANDSVYDLVEHWHPSSDQLLWIRSDKNSAERPCPRLCGVLGARCCTVCHLGRVPKEVVSVSVGGGSWTPTSTRCGC